jgi:peptide/nickel transport system permease protein
VGRLVIGAVLRRDWPIIQGGLLLTTCIFVAVNLLVDMLYLLVDPRLRSRHDEPSGGADMRALLARRNFAIGLALVGSWCSRRWGGLAGAVRSGEEQFPQPAGVPDDVFLLGTDRFGGTCCRASCMGRGEFADRAGGGADLGHRRGLIGLVAGWWRGVDAWLMRIMDGLMAFPGLLLAIALAATLGPSDVTVAIALSVAYTPRTSRVMRGAVLVARAQDYVEAARAVGARTARLLWHHVLPACAAPWVVQQTYVFAIAILAEAVLSFVRGSAAAAADAGVDHRGRAGQHGGGAVDRAVAGGGDPRCWCWG